MAELSDDMNVLIKVIADFAEMKGIVTEGFRNIREGLENQAIRIAAIESKQQNDITAIHDEIKALRADISQYRLDEARHYAEFKEIEQEAMKNQKAGDRVLGGVYKVVYIGLVTASLALAIISIAI